MKTIGVLGGMSWESTAEWYRLANEQVRDREGGYHSARLLIDSVDFAEIEALQASGDWDEAGRLLARHAARLERAGAGILVLCTNTMHIVAESIEAAVTVPLIHIADATAEAVLAAGVRTVGLLGTAFTMEQAFYRDRLAAHGLDVLIPAEPERQVVHRVIYEELVHGVVSDSSREAYRRIISALRDRGAEGVILGCTEIELLISSADAAVPVFPTTAIHVEAALRAAKETHPG